MSFLVAKEPPGSKKARHSNPVTLPIPRMRVASVISAAAAMESWSTEPTTRNPARLAPRAAPEGV